MKNVGIQEMGTVRLLVEKNTAVLPDDQETSLIVFDPNHFRFYGGANNVHCITHCELSTSRDAQSAFADIDYFAVPNVSLRIGKFRGYCASASRPMSFFASEVFALSLNKSAPHTHKKY